MKAISEVKSQGEGSPSRTGSGQVGTRRNTKSVQKVSKQVPRQNAARHAKTDIRYWQRAVYLPTFFRRGEVRQTANWCVKIQHVGRREVFSLQTPNRAAAAARAREIYLSLQSGGWEATLAKFKPSVPMAERTVTTVGEFVEEVKAKASGRGKTIESYCRALRTIVAAAFSIDGGPSKYDYRTGGRQRWLAQIHAVKLARLTPQKVQEWKIAFLRRAGEDPLKQRTARISVNSLMRQAKSLFAPDVLKFILSQIPASPFNGVRFEPKQSMRYRSSFDLEALIRGAFDELTEEQLKIFLLAVMAGLRRNEIDKLEWSAFRWQDATIRIETTAVLQPKTQNSTGDVEVDPELIKIFRTFSRSAHGSFVVESVVPVRLGVTYSHYRCQSVFEAVTKWLRRNGVVGKRPLHTLRKEYGSQICARHGIYAASHALRHGDISITSQHYLDSRRRVTVGLGSLITGRGIPATGDQKTARRIRQASH